MAKHCLNTLFEPESVAVFGASERKGAVGTLVFENMTQGGFTGEVYPINPKHAKVRGYKAFPDLDSLAKSVDLAVITTPAVCGWESATPKQCTVPTARSWLW